MTRLKLLLERFPVKNLATSLAFLTVLLVQAAAANASVQVAGSDWNGSRSTYSGQLFASGGWGDDGSGFYISWLVTLPQVLAPGALPWSYEYTISGIDADGNLQPLSKSLSHWILQVSDDATFEDFASFNVPVESEIPGDHNSGPNSGNPDMPGNLFGFKWEAPDNTEWTTMTFSFTSTRAPAWGDFFAKSANGGNNGVGTYAYNSGFGTFPFPTNGVYGAWIVRPNGETVITGDIPAVPEPATWLIFSGLAICFGVNVWRKKKQTA